MSRTVVSEGHCTCIFEPRGDHGLEGYALNDRYKFQQMKDSQGIYYRVYPDEGDSYYETCTSIVFKQHFRTS